MGNVISSFLVGIGVQFDKKGADQVGSSIDGIKSKALQAGAVVAGAFGIKALTADFAQANDRLGKFSRTFGVIPNDVAALGRALEHEGGSIESFIGQIESLERLRALTPDQVGGLFARAGIIGVDPSVILNAKSATEAYTALGDVFKGLSQSQRLNAAQLFGLDEASIRLLSNGTEQVIELARVQSEMRPVTSQMTRAAADFNDEMQDLGTNIGRVGDKISSALLPEINNMIKGTNEWMMTNKGVVDSGLDTMLPEIADQFGALSISATGFAASGILGGLAKMGSMVPVIGAGLAGMASSLAAISGVGAAAAGGFAVGTGIQKSGILDTPAQWLGFKDYQNYFDFMMDPIFGTNVSGRWGGGEQSNATAQLATQPHISTYAMGNRRGLINLSGDYQANRQRPLNVTLELDGTVISKKIIDVVDQQNQQAIDDLTSSVGG